MYMVLGDIGCWLNFSYPVENGISIVIVRILAMKVMRAQSYIQGVVVLYIISAHYCGQELIIIRYNFYLPIV